MNKKSHTTITTIFLITLFIYIKFILQKDYFLWVFILPSITVAWAPDIDLSIPPIGHRSWITHSIIPEVILFIFVLPYEINMLSFLFLIWIPVVGLHDLCDCRFCARKRKGFYTIKILMRPAIAIFHKDAGQITVWRTLWGMNGAASTVYLIMNFIISIIILGAWLWLV